MPKLDESRPFLAVNIAVLTVSDTRSLDDDKSGRTLAEMIERDGHKVAEVSKKWFRVADTYGVEIAPDQNDIIILAITVAVDAMAHKGD